ncbi:hypothetical protein MNB_SUP05-SYMBIONT-5-672 [hydrothermal vent metagenome]|uniref:Uncharacterized protein n=1 Tax=hydrothermal vent metagenome TaxID=652676 RepID=A0A1W1E1Q9_9ZZZZ
MRFFISLNKPSTAFSPNLAPGFDAGVKKVNLNLSRRFSLRSCVSKPNKNSNIGPPRIALGSFGLPAKPMAILPPSIALTLSRIFSAALKPSQGVMAFSIPGNFLINRPPEAIINASLSTRAPLSSTTVLPSSSKLVTLLATWRTFIRLKKLSNGTTISFLSAAPDGTQIKLGI